MDPYDYSAITANFVKELRLAASGQTASLSWGKNIFPQQPLVTDGEQFQVLVIGGTNYLSALLTKTQDRLAITNIVDGVVPIFQTEELFLTFTSQLLDPNVSHVAVNFAHPIVPEFTDGVLDGRFVFGSKENAFAGLENKLMGQTIASFVLDKKGQKIKVSVANDTICLLLSGLTQFSWNQVAAGIVGTGMNFAIFADAETAINLEAGDFNKFTILESTKVLDPQTQRPEHYWYEKEMSGRYLAEHFNYLIESKNLGSPHVDDGELLTTIAGQNIPQVSEIAQGIFKRSADLFACGGAAITQFLNRDITFVMQGSVFWKGYRYQELVAEQYRALTGKEFKALKIEHADILGAAKLIA